MQRVRSMVFEDDDVVRALLWQVLDSRNHEVFTFPDPALCPLGVHECRQCNLGEACADIIFSDVDMPRSNGLDFIETLQNNGCRCPKFVMMSGRWSVDALERASQLDCLVLHKPFSVSQIVAVCEEVEASVKADRTLAAFADLIKHPRQGGFTSKRR